jgi:amino acid transporter
MVLASGKTASEWEKRGIAIAVISFITLVHILLPNWGVRGMNAIGVMKVVLLLFIVLTGWVVLSGSVRSVQDPYASFHNAFAGSATSSNLYATALFKVLNSFAGYVAPPV